MPGAKIRFRVSKFETYAKTRDWNFEVPPFWIWIRQQFEPSEVLKFWDLFEGLKRENDFRLSTLGTSMHHILPQLFACKFKRNELWKLTFGMQGSI